MKHLQFKVIFPLVVALVAATFLYLSIFDLGFWDAIKGPMGGFYPALASIVLIPCCLLSSFQARKEAPAIFNRDDIKVAIASGVTIALFPVIGMVASIALFLVFWLKIIEKKKWLFIAKFTVIATGIVWLVFAYWLNVQFPTGLLFEMLGL